jgi:glycine/D-amino acid oxidase-like deaminating enzyme
MKYEVFWKNPGYQIRPELKEDIECDYLIVGGGIAGVSTAYFLAKAGAKNIVLAEKNHIGSGATGKAAGTITIRAERDLEDIIGEFGMEKSQIFWKRTHASLKDLKQVITEENIECDAEFQDTLMCGFKGKNYVDLRKEYEAEKVIEGTTKLLEGEQLKEEINSPLFSHGVLSSEHAVCVNPLKFIQGFSQAVEKRGVNIYENTSVLKAANGVAETQHGNIRYKKLVWAIDADYPAEELKNLKTTLIVTRPLTPGELSNIGFAHNKKVVWDSHKNEKYFKVTHDNRLMVGFGGILVHKKHRGTDPHFPHLKQLEIFIKKVFPYLDIDIEYAWSGHFAVNGHWSKGPIVRLEGNNAAIAGCASQILCFMAGSYIASRLLGQGSSLEIFFTD